ncbi:hypothetical protein TMEN_8598 [Trichophyton mentagrophytes]|uniref:Uncharacterized protein n=1 Tax=Trichophyton tonsurans (strain CBS 112818) TaxID=647933 RepID=F2SBH1_TRIT1|nr:hypothetical protein TESG_08678 [Trichophyton tonsurans CBS 112818]GBF65880.1 hypothetical protein TMEN_8598 [Trichophyton mentagrophytes]
MPLLDWQQRRSGIGFLTREEKENTTSGHGVTSGRQLRHLITSSYIVVSYSLAAGFFKLDMTFCNQRAKTAESGKFTEACGLNEP